MQEFSILRSDYDVRVGLKRLELDKDSLVIVSDAAFLARINTTPNHALNAAGTYSYHEGIRKMRDILVGENWASSRESNVEYVENQSIMTRIAFCNVFKAASTIYDPEPVSPRRSASAAACNANYHQFTLDLAFEKESEPSKLPVDIDWKTYYLMVGEDGTAELSLPLVCESGKFYELVERIFLVTEEDLDNDPHISHVPSDLGPEPDYEIEVARKT